MGMGIVETLKREFDFEEEWVSYELHPETPKEGVAISEKFPELNLGKFRAGLNSKSEQYGIRFGDFSLISNSSISLQVGELAKDLRKYSMYHKNIFEAYFVDALDIGRIEVVVEVAKKSQIPESFVHEALNSGKYLARLEQARQEGAELGINAVPTFIINGVRKLVGAQPLVRFKKILSER
ncbi:MAG: DsbA family protein [Desulfomonilaceae bacterium]